MGNVQYNGISLPDQWPPIGHEKSWREPMPVPYLDSPPEVIPIDIGRQLFVDDFVVEKATLTRTFHTPEKWRHNPILKPETEWEERGLRDQPDPASCACPFDDGVFYDPDDGHFKMWYMACALGHTALAISRDGIHWERPTFDVVEDTNIVIPYDADFRRDSFSPVLDHNTRNLEERFKALIYVRSKALGKDSWLCTSPDGIHWERRLRVKHHRSDNTTIFYNPFRRKWVMSIGGAKEDERMRMYKECDEFFDLANGESEIVYWCGADDLDVPDPDWIVQDRPQLYCLNATAYESLMLGLFAIHYGPENDVCSKGSFPKLTQIKVGFSRDGFHWDRPNRDHFIQATKREGDWDRAYLRPCGNCCTVTRDHLMFYYCGFSGKSSSGKDHMYAGGSTHLAILRRDGFASMNAGQQSGHLTTRPVRFSGRRLFVNCNVPHGSLVAEVLDLDGNVIEPFSAETCIPVTGDHTSVQVTWPGTSDLRALSDQSVKFRFWLRNGQFYSFWISLTERGESNGYVGGGGPGFTGPRDI